ncbi:MAG: diaminopimelate decarboxylase, partial [Dysgonamonadaceae bacterium]|nr:diaminopimelate decarboxylase [Dysgonamonadaceae bacterium]
MYCQLDKTQVNSLIKKYGSPLYIFHTAEFEENYYKILNAMRAIYSKYNIAYSYKTNYTPKICECVKNLGGYAEVVSEMEFELAKKIGYDCAHIVYNGPVKGNGLFEHLSNGGVANIDSIDEMKTVVNFAQKNPRTNIRIAFRVNIDIGQGY